MTPRILNVPLRVLGVVVGLGVSGVGWGQTAPDAVNDVGNTDSNTILTVPAASGVLSNDTDADGDMLTVTEVGSFAGTRAAANVGVTIDGSHGGTFNIAVDGSYTFNPDGDFGIDAVAIGSSIQTAAYYRASDGTMSDTARLLVSVLGRAPPDTAPSFGGATEPNHTYLQGATITNERLPVASGGNGALTYTLNPPSPFGLLFSQTSATLVTLSGAPSSAGGPTMVTLTVHDADSNMAASDADTVVFSITVTAADDSTPSFAGRTQPDLSFVAGVAITNPVVLPMANGGNNAGGSPTYSLEPDVATAVPGLVFDATPTVRTLSGTPTPTSGPVAFSYFATDDDGDRDSLTFTVVVTGTTVPDPDTAPTFGATTQDDLTLTTTTTANVTLPAASGGNGVLSYALDTSAVPGLTFTPATRRLSGMPTTAAAAVSLTYTASDGDMNTAAGDTVSLTFTVTVTAPAPVPNRQPVPNSDRGSTDADTVRTVADGATGTTNADLLLNDTDADGDTLSITRFGTSAGSLVNVGGTVNGSSGGRFTVSGNGAWSFDPNGNFDDLAAGATRDTRIFYLVSDGSRSAVTTLTVTVTGTAAANQAPVAVDDTGATDPDSRIEISAPGVLSNDSDPNGDTFTVTGLGTTDSDQSSGFVGMGSAIGPAFNVTGGGWFAISADGTWSFNPDGDFSSLAPGMSATTSVVYQISDGNGETATATITVTVTAPPDTAPSFGTTMQDDLTFRQARAITPTVQLPAATGGNGALSYALDVSAVPGLVYTAATRTLSGTPATIAAAVTLTYTASDADTNMADSDTASLTFTVTVIDPQTGTISLSVTGSGGDRDSTAPGLQVDEGDTIVLTTTFHGKTGGTIQTRVDASGTARYQLTGEGTTVPYDISAVSLQSSAFSSVSHGALDAGETATTNFTVRDDTESENDETLILTLSGTPNTLGSETGSAAWTFGTPAAVTVTIRANDDSEAYIAETGPSTVAEGSDPLNVPVAIRGAARTGVSTVNFAFSGTATTADYSVTTGGGVTYDATTTPPSGSITLSATQTSRNIPVAFTTDADTADETFIVTLTGHSGMVPSPAMTAFVGTPRTFTVTAAAAYVPMLVASTGGVTEDVAVNTDRNLVTTGSVTFMGGNAADQTFTPSSQTGTYGALTFRADGTWTYTADNDQTAIQELHQPDVEQPRPGSSTPRRVFELTDEFTVTGVDGGVTTTTTVTITITGADDTPTFTTERTAVTVTEDVGAETGSNDLVAETRFTITGGDAGEDSVVGLGGTVDTLGRFGVGVGSSLWTYRVDNTRSEVQNLAAGQRLVEGNRFINGPDGTRIFMSAVIIGSADITADISTSEITANEGVTIATYTVTLNTDTDDAIVTITPMSSDTDAATVTPSSLVFTDGDWNVARTVTVSGLDDDDAVDEAVTISHTVTLANSQPGDSVTGVEDVQFNVIDNEMRGLVFANVSLEDVVSSAERPGEVSEGSVFEGSVGIYSVALSTQPLPTDSVVTVSLASADTAVATVSPASVMFTHTNWDVPARITVTGVQDDDANPAGDTVSISHTINGGASDYMTSDHTAADDVTIRVTEDDTVGVRVSPAALTLEEEESGVYTVALASQPVGGAVMVAVSFDAMFGESLTLSSGGVACASTTGCTLNFPAANWNMPQTISVSALRDTNSTSENVTITHTARGADYGAESATVVITLDDAGSEALETLNEAVLPEVTYVISGVQIGAIARRVDALSGAAPGGGGAGGLAAAGDGAAGGGLRFNLGGKSSLAAMAATHAKSLADDDDINMKELLNGSVFSMPLGASGDSSEVSGVGLWGGGDYRRVGGDEGGSDWSGDLFSFHLGADTRVLDDLLLGMMVSWSEADIDYEVTLADGDPQKGEYEMDLTSVLPYMSWTSFDGALDMWAALGGGKGDVKVTPEGENGEKLPASKGEITTSTVGIGGSGKVLSSGNHSLRVKAEAFVTETEFNGVAGNATATLADLEVSANRVRLSLEAETQYATQNGGIATPSIELGARYDGGDGENTGTGMEVGTGLVYSNAARGMTLETHARGLFTHSGGAEDWGVGGSVRIEPRGGGEAQGLSLTLAPAYGNTGSTVDKIWADGVGDNIDGGVSTPTKNTPLTTRLNARIAYATQTTGWQITPYSEMSMSKDTRNYRVGMQWERGGRYDLNLFADREEKAGTNHGVWLEGAVRF